VLDLQGPARASCSGTSTRPPRWTACTADCADPFRPLVPRYDMVLTYGGGDPVVEAYLGFGARDCVPIYNALDPDTHHPVAPDPRFEADLGFLGNRLPDREARVEEFFLRAAGAAARARFLLGGSGWDDKPMPANVRNVGHVYTADHNAFNRTPLAVLNVSRESMARYGFSPATRVFEAAGAAACLITDAWEGIELSSSPARECWWRATARRSRRTCSALDAGARPRIGQAAYRRVLAEHTYAHRAAQLEALLEGRDAARALEAAA
jgi:spore maturation protein CgeB